ncbi:ATP-binding protein [Komagataeibacter sp. FXV3]|uniref:ATP-binding protein n=1 Tax=Komagataeibacter sp. FXV3 TaxID=2608998 RepID=UPI001D113297|nr:ATP-binding protein [Komagataeibacter sp. FXV3]
MSSANIWDPLESNIADQEILSSAKKREIKNILKSYVGTYDPISELIQNAMDAIERRIENEESDKFSPKVIIKINIKENSFEVTDNGCGFELAEFKAFLAPNISFKDNNKTRGNKGVGATYIAYGFNDLYMKTGNNSFKFEGIFKNGRNWVDDTAGRVPRPKIEQIKSGNNNEIFQGTTFKIYFGGKGTRPKDLGWYQANTANQWLYILLTKTPLGHISLPGLEPDPKVFQA